jgi:rRNA maturation endonuclease Nob1
VDFVSQSLDDEIAFELKEVDYLELAYVYLSWKNDGKGYARCQRCDRLMRQGKTKPRKYCEECAKDVERENTRERVRRFREKCNA